MCQSTRDRARRRGPGRRVACVFALLSLCGTTLGSPGTEAEYQEAVDVAVRAASIEYDARMVRGNSVFGVAAACVEMATRNPDATADEIASFARALHQELEQVYVDDPQLRRDGHFANAVQHGLRAIIDQEPEHGVRVTDVMNGMLGRLGLSYNPAEAGVSAWDARQAYIRDMLTYDPTVNRPALTTLRAALTGSVEPEEEPIQPLHDGFAMYLVEHGWGIDANGIGDYPFINTLLNDPSFPTTLVDYQSDIGPGEGGLETLIAQELVDARDRMADPVPLLAGVADLSDPELPNSATDPERLAAVIEAYVAFTRDSAEARARMSIMGQLLGDSSDQSERNLAREAEESGLISDLIAAAGAAIEIGKKLAPGIGTIRNALAPYIDLEFLSVDTRNLIEVGLDLSKLDFTNTIILGFQIAKGIGQLLGLFEQGPTPEQIILDQINAMRQQIADFQQRVEERFDQIDARLTEIMESLADGFAQIDATLAEIQVEQQFTQERIDELAASHRDTQNALAVQFSAILGFEARIGDLIRQVEYNEMVAAANGALPHRDVVRVDLDFTGTSQAYQTYQDIFSEKATTEASSIFASDNASVNRFNVATVLAPELIQPTGGTSFLRGRTDDKVNILDRVAGEVRGTPLSTDQSAMANPQIWSEAADAFAELARQYPWYYAVTASGVTDPAQRLIDAGEHVRDSLASARDPQMFDTLKSQYETAADALTSLIYTGSGSAWSDVLVSNGVPSSARGLIDPFSAATDDFAGVAPFVQRINCEFCNTDLVASTSHSLHELAGIAANAWSLGVFGVQPNPTLEYSFIHFDGVNYIRILVRDNANIQLILHKEIRISRRNVDASVNMFLEPSDLPPPFNRPLCTGIGSSVSISNGSYATITGTAGLQKIEEVLAMSTVYERAPSTVQEALNINVMPTSSNPMPRSLANDLLTSQNGFVDSIFELTTQYIDPPDCGPVTRRMTQYKIELFDPVQECSDQGDETLAELCDLLPNSLKYFQTENSALARIIDADLALLEIKADFVDVVNTEMSSTNVDFFDGIDNMAEATLRLDSAVALMDAFMTYGTPGSIDSDQILRAALRGHENPGASATLSPFVLNSAAIREQISPLALPSVWWVDPGGELRTRLDAISDMIDRYVDPSVQPFGHANVERTIASLEALQRDGFQLASNDAYALAAGETLAIDATAGLLANDRTHGFDGDGGFIRRTVEVLTSPSVGTLSVADDGTFTYEAPCNTSGVVTFEYRVRGEILDAPEDSGGVPISASAFAFSEPATVRLAILPTACNSDGDDDVDIIDLLTFMESWFELSIDGDFDGNQEVTVSDLLGFLSCWFPASVGAGC